MIINSIKYGNLKKSDEKNRILTIGNFDGVHQGHKKLLEYCVNRAAKLNIVSSVITFCPHPRIFFQLDPKQECIQTIRDKCEEIFKTGIQQIILARFNSSLSNTSATEFVSKQLVDNLNMVELVVGEDFQFGKNREGNIRLLKKLGTKYDFTTTTISNEKYKTSKISSSLLREIAREGDFDSVKYLRNSNLKVSGHVCHGMKLGRQLDYPTINIKIPNEFCFSGVFVVKTFSRSEFCNLNGNYGIANIGTRPTVENCGRKLLEVYVLDWSGNAYGAMVTVEIIKKISDEENLNNLVELKDKIKKDECLAREFIRVNNEKRSKIKKFQ